MQNFNQCIYFIKNLKTKYVYIGSTSHYQVRKDEHFEMLNNNNHYNSRLQKAYNKDKKYFIIGQVITFEFASKDILLDHEQMFLDTISNKYNILINSRDHLKGIYGTNKMTKERQMKINFDGY